MTGPKIPAPASGEWMARGACVGHEQPDLWHPKGRGTTKAEARQIREAKEVCGGCEVRASCLADAIANRREGIWGGTTDAERARLIRRPDAPPPLQHLDPTPSEDCGTFTGVSRHRRAQERYCEDCRYVKNSRRNAKRAEQKEAS